jgi:hypothetical protein
LQEVCKKWKHICLIKTVFDFYALGNYDSNDNTDIAHLIMLAAIHVTVLHIHEGVATLYFSWKVRDTLVYHYFGKHWQACKPTVAEIRMASVVGRIGEENINMSSDNRKRIHTNIH